MTTTIDNKVCFIIIIIIKTNVLYIQKITKFFFWWGVIYSCDSMSAMLSLRKDHLHLWHRKAVHTTGGLEVLSMLAFLAPPPASLLCG